MALSRRRIAGVLRAVAVLAILAPVGYCIARAAGAPAHEKPFLDSNQVAMNRMMIGMAIRPSGNVDIDFAAMMIPHHQGAVDMAKAELQYGTNEQLRRIAQEIIVDQMQEIAAMKLAAQSVNSSSMNSR